MKILDRHIGRHVVKGSLMALAVLVALDLVFAFAAEAPDIGQGDYDFGKSFIYVLLTTPRRAYDFMPMAAIVGSLIMLGTLASASEFVAMRSAGVSITWISRSIVKGGLLLVIIALILGEGIAPFSEPYAQQMRSFARTQSTALKSEHGIWARDGRSFVNIRHIRPGGELRGLDIYEFDEAYRLRLITHAEKATFGNGSWVLHDIKQVKLADEVMNIKHYTEASWNALLNPELLGVLAVKPEQLPVWRLTTYIEYLRVNGLETEPYEFALWQKITAPFSILIMLFLSVPFVFSQLRTAGAGQRALVGIVLGMAYFLVTHVALRMGEVYNFDPVVSNTLPSLCFLVAGFVGIRLVR